MGIFEIRAFGHWCNMSLCHYTISVSWNSINNRIIILFLVQYNREWYKKYIKMFQSYIALKSSIDRIIWNEIQRCYHNHDTGNYFCNWRCYTFGHIFSPLAEYCNANLRIININSITCHFGLCYYFLETAWYWPRKYTRNKLAVFVDMCASGKFYFSEWSCYIS